MLDPHRLRDALTAQLAQAETAEEESLAADAAVQRPDLTDLDTWCRTHVEIRGVPFSYEGHEYLRAIYADDHPYQVYRKAAQVGISTRILLEGFYLCERYGAKVLYYLSTDNDAYDFSNDRINTQIDDSSHLQRLIDTRERGRDNVGLRHVSRGTLFCRGMFTRRKVKSVDGDVLVLDELDEADQANKRFALDRIMHSPLQYVRELSQPSIPDYGIDETFAESDQRYWHLICPSCGARNCMELELEETEGRLLPRHILPVPRAASWARPGQRWYRACLQCGAPLRMDRGEWIALYPSRSERRGYQLSQLYRSLPMAGYADPADWIMEQLLSARKTMDKTRVTISILGLPYAGDRAPITDATLNACEGDGGLELEGSGCYMGVDQGDLLHVVIEREGPQQRAQVVWLEITDNWRRLAQLITQYGVRCLVIDALPNKHSAKGLVREARLHRCRGYIQYFTGATLQRREEGEGGEAIRVVNVDRTESLDETVQQVRDMELLLPQMGKLSGHELATYETFRAQCKMLVKDLAENAKGVARWEYKHRVPNHFGMALNSCRIARELAPVRGPALRFLGNVYPE